MKDYRSLSHTKWDCKYHVVFIPKYRRKRIFGKLRGHLGEILHELAKQKQSRIVEGHLRPDHVHMCISIPPKFSVSSVVGFIKGKSAISLADEMGAGRNGLCGSAVAWCPVRHGGQSAPGCGRKPAMSPALAFVRQNTAQENARERAWGSSPEGLLPDPL